MGVIKLGVFLVGLLAVLVGLISKYPSQFYDLISPIPNKNNVLPFGDESWTKSSQNKDESVRPFTIDFPKSSMDDLKNRLKQTKYSKEIPGINFQYGFPASELKKVVKYWMEDYDWGKQQAHLNQYNHFKTNIEGLDIHFVRSTPKDLPKDTKVVPIIMVHGWPSTFFEYYKLIPLLNKPRKIGSTTVAFDVIIPSLPGYGFSQASEKPGLDSAHIARIFCKLMKRLKLDKYALIGGDWGSVIVRRMSVMYPERVTGLHLTMYSAPFGYSILNNLLAYISPSLVIDPSQTDMLFFSQFTKIIRESGYFHLQATRPDTVGAGLQDSPAGLAAYILEKYAVWTTAENLNKTDGGLTNYFTMDELLTTIMLYWMTDSITTSQRLYKEQFSSTDGFLADRIPIEVPTVLSSFKGDLVHTADEIVKPFYKKLVKISHHEKGGHFAAMERPIELAEDTWYLMNALFGPKEKKQQ